MYQDISNLPADILREKIAGGVARLREWQIDKRDREMLEAMVVACEKRLAELEAKE